MKSRFVCRPGQSFHDKRGKRHDRVTYYDAKKGLVREVRTDSVRVPFRNEQGLSLYFRRGGCELDIPSGGSVEGVHCSLRLEVTERALLVHVTLLNRTDRDFAPEALGLRLGVDSYMVDYPSWNDKFFPTLLRAEKTHFWGYFMSPLGKALAVTCREPIAAWELAYNHTEGVADSIDFGHRIYTGKLLLLTSSPLPERHPDGLSRLRAGERMTRTVRLTPLASLDELPRVLSDEGLPSVGFERYTVARGEAARLTVSAAEYLMGIHRCLEQSVVPDARMRGATLRFWEAQYDVMIRANMLNSPHGWTSWKTYATYYLYLLTGKEAYLADTVDTMGACLACMGEDGVLRWGFAVDPCIRAEMLVPDKNRPIRDGYKSASYLKTPAYRGKFEERSFGECYVDMISGWYRMGEERISGGYFTCPRIYDDHVEQTDPQGGACDNDVHEHFKCLEEPLLGKAFLVLDAESGALRGYGCSAKRLSDGKIKVTFTEERTEYLHVNTPVPLVIFATGCEYRVEIGLTMLSLL